MEDHTYIGVLRNPGFVNLWVNQILVQLAYNSLNFALIVWVFRLTNSNTAVAGLMFSIYLPAVLFGLFAGVLVDIMDRRLLYMIINILLAGCFFSLVPLKSVYPAILLVAFLINALATFYQSNEASAIPLVVKKEQLLMANSLFSMTLFMTFLCGFGLSGPLLHAFGIDAVFLLEGMSLMVAFLLSLLMPSIRASLDSDALLLKDAITSRSVRLFRSLALREIKKALRVIRGKPQVLIAILIISGEQAVIGLLGVLIPSFFERELQINAADASYILIAPLGLGMILGALLIGKFGHYFAKRRLVSWGIVVAGILLALVGAGPILNPVTRRIHRPRRFFRMPSHSLLLSVGAFFLGFAMVSVIVPTQTVLQEETPESTRGKIFSVLAACMSAFAIVPVLLLGSLSDLVGPVTIFILLGSVIVLLGVMALFPRFLVGKRYLSPSFRDFFGLPRR